TLEITSDIALWYRPGTPPRPIRWVLVRNPEGKRPPQAFFSTDTAREPADIILSRSRLPGDWKPLPATPFMAGSGGGWIAASLVLKDRKREYDHPPSSPWA
ncbi:hypothetical protein, partial [Pararhodobacter sp. SW119]|uniref:hypothetical protein n=1 Tax=Pararhodobacter sp. SW119 TaxID=2780075 RepID=UPI001ADF46D6